MLPVPNLASRGEGQDIIPYLAGFFDGEGCVTLQYRDASGKGKSPRYTLRMSATQVADHAEPLWKLKEVFGGWTGPARQESTKHPTYRATMIWHADNKVAANALQLMLPHLVVKRAAAYLALAFLHWKDVMQVCRKHGEKQSDFEVQIGQEFKDLFHIVNRRGTTTGYDAVQ